MMNLLKGENIAIFSGWLALILFVTSFYLAVRSPLLNWLFGGLKHQLRWHHLVASLSVAFMFFHVAQEFWLFRQHYELLFDWRDIGLLSGWLTLLGIFLALPSAFYRIEIPYRRWRLVHLVTAVCLVTALMHTFLLFEPNNYGEWAVFLLVFTLGTFALLLAIILPTFSVWGKKYVITRITEIRPKLFLLRLQSNSNQRELKHFQFDPGHFIYLKFFHRNFSCIWHPFTIISRPSDSYIELLIKARGKDTNQLDVISLPGPISIIAPFGDSFWKLDENQLWIAYGVGVAIFLAAIRSFPSAFSKKIHFICCDDSATKMFFSDEFDNCMRKNSNFTWEPYIGTGIQFIAEFSNKQLDTKNIDKVRICGHPLFQKNLKAMLVSRGIQSQNINLEGLL